MIKFQCGGDKAYVEKVDKKAFILSRKAIRKKRKTVFINRLSYCFLHTINILSTNEDKLLDIDETYFFLIYIVFKN